MQVYKLTSCQYKFAQHSGIFMLLLLLDVLIWLYGSEIGEVNVNVPVKMNIKGNIMMIIGLKWRSSGALFLLF